ncbi:MAG: aminotransferase class IV [Firmicutes bacterium]|nr:aminotransferase class IV [Bacillota bacterium]
MQHGIFETIAVHHGHPVFPECHLNRLEYAMKELNITAAYDRNTALCEIFRRAEGKDQIAIKVLLNKNGLSYSQRENPYKTMNYNQGFTVCLSEKNMNETDPLCYCKSTNRAIPDEEKQKAIQNGCHEVIFTNQKGHITEGAVSNIFCIKKGEIFTPSVSSGLLDGIMRRFLISIHGNTVKETILTKEDLLCADEIFLTNSLMGIMPICSFEGKRYLTGGKATQLSEYYKTLLDTLR